jgi:two-component system NarL family sensor kinase
MSLELDEVFKNLLRQSGMLLGYVFEREQMERRIAQLAEIERSQIAQQLHDGLSQHLAAAAMLVESLKLRLANEGSSQTEMTTKTLLALEEAKQQARALGKMLAPTMSHSDGIAVALSEVAEESRHAFNVDCVLECRGTTAHINRFTAEQLVRFARDAIRYMHKNCRATHISMIMQSEPGMSISIRGNGRAPDIAPRNQEDDLRALQTRAHLIGGEFSIQCNGPDGTTITCASETNFGQ